MEQIPWVEKYRPSDFETIILEPHNKIMLQNMLTLNQIPHMLFYGPPGTGKTTTIMNFINKYQKINNQQHKELIMHLNASDDRGIEVIRTQIYSFTTSLFLFNKGTKFIILDEVDYMTKSAQFALFNLMKENIENVRFCLICNYISKLDKSLQDMCMSFKFNTLPKENMVSYLETIIIQEKLTFIGKSDIHNIIGSFKSDMRSMINYLQGISHDQKLSPILSEDSIHKLVTTFLTKTIVTSVKKMTQYLYTYNIEKSILIIRIFDYIIEKYPIQPQTTTFIKSVLHHKNYYLDEFNIFFISNLTSILSS
jgi:DNA polymerase III delta prime subunit